MNAVRVVSGLIVLCAGCVGVAGQEIATLNEKADGYRGIWYMNQPSHDEYVYKYSGGLGTYCAKHRPFAVYCSQVEKTFFCYGGATEDDDRRLLHMVSYFDHRTGRAPRPTILLDKRTDDAHDNPVIAVDARGFVWIFSTSHGRSRPSLIHRSAEPYDIGRFQRVAATRRQGAADVPITNFSYMQAWHDPEHGFLCLFTRYGDPAARTLMFMRSADGVRFSPWQRLAAVEQGHYQVSTLRGGKLATAFNMHPQDKGLNWRTNLYYIESVDQGRSWQTADGAPVATPIVRADSPALVHDYRAARLNVYLKDVQLDGHGRPVILVLTSRGYQSGPQSAPRTWTTARWTGQQWRVAPATSSDNNYDMGSLYLEADGTWRIIVPTVPGPQPFNPGGEVASWTSVDQGRSWRMQRQLTHDSRKNHTYVRRPVDAHPEFYALWADGHGRQPSSSSLYFADRTGNVFRLPRNMETDWAVPQRVE